MVSYNSFNYQHLISPWPLLMITGTKAQTLDYSRTAVESTGELEEFFAVENRSHFDLYDDLQKTAPKIVEFFAKHLV